MIFDQKSLIQSVLRTGLKDQLPDQIKQQLTFFTSPTIKVDRLNHFNNAVIHSGGCTMINNDITQSRRVQIKANFK